MPDRSPSDLVLRATLVAAALFGIGARLWLAVATLGTDDIKTWHQFAEAIDARGLRWTYSNLRDFNHPPLAGYYGVWALATARLLELPFSFVFKLLPIAADALSAWVLYRMAEGRSRGAAVLACVLFAASPASLAVTGYHGNTDSAAAALALLALFLFDRSRMLAAGLALGAAINVKLIPALLVPLLILQCRRRDDALRFVGGLAVAALPFVLVLASVGSSFVRNAILYGSEPNRWGLYGFLDLAAAGGDAAPRALRDLYWRWGRYVVLLALMAIAWLGRKSARWSAVELGTLGVLAFLILTPGFGVQYTVYAVAPLLATRPRLGAAYSLLAGVFLCLIYAAFWTGGLPPFSYFRATFPPAAVAVGAIAWATLVAAAASLLARPQATAR